NVVISGIFFGGAAASASASLAGPVDTTTLGNWRSAYGRDGYQIVADPSAGNPSFPAYATVSVSGNSTFPWAASTANPAALRNAANTGNLAATWYSASSFDIHVNLSDSQSHLVTLYALDWDNVTGTGLPLRSEQFDVLDAATGSVLATQT